VKTYELITIVKPQMADNEVSDFIEKVKAIVVSDGGEVLTGEKLGRKKLSHPINHNREGFYIMLRLKASAQLVSKLEKQLKLMEQVLRSMLLTSSDSKKIVKPAVAK
jgi:small subunit ribosomal protein S6